MTRKKKVQALERLNIDLEGYKTGCQVSLLHAGTIPQSLLSAQGLNVEIEREVITDIALRSIISDPDAESTA